MYFQLFRFHHEQEFAQDLPDSCEGKTCGDECLVETKLNGASVGGVCTMKGKCEAAKEPPKCPIKHQKNHHEQEFAQDLPDSCEGKTCGDECLVETKLNGVSVGGVCTMKGKCEAAIEPPKCPHIKHHNSKFSEYINNDYIQTISTSGKCINSDIINWF